MDHSTALGLGLAVLLTGPALATTQEVRFERDDGAVLVGTFRAASGEMGPAVLLLHQAAADRHELDFLLPELHTLGIHTLAVDLRGHGESVAADGDGTREAHARKMYEQAGEPRRLEILAGSSAHGASMLAESAEMRRVVLEWLESQL